MILIAGPCVVEEYSILDQTISYIKETIAKLNIDIDLYFKSSIRKENRTKIENYRGIDWEEGIAWMSKIASQYGVKICTDFHNELQLNKYAGKFDMIQIPAFLGRQTELLECFAKQRTAINYKKPQFMSPNDIDIPIKILKNSGAKKIFVTDRGTCFGYKDWMMDARHVRLLRNSIQDDNIKILADITHPNKQYERPLSACLAKDTGMSYISAGADGVFLEVCPDPDKALCDNNTMLNLAEFKDIIESLCEVYKIVND
jgi:2-dehydro-3-deoxyphosphooctonate aldolase (KDO 8-P synthase)